MQKHTKLACCAYFCEKTSEIVANSEKKYYFCTEYHWLMATTKIDNVRQEILRWAFQRAGYSEEKAVEAFPKLQDWLSGEKKPTISQLQNFASKFFVPFGYLFLHNSPYCAHWLIVCHIGGRILRDCHKMSWPCRDNRNKDNFIFQLNFSRWHSLI